MYSSVMVFRLTNHRRSPHIHLYQYPPRPPPSQLLQRLHVVKMPHCTSMSFSDTMYEISSANLVIFLLQSSLRGYSIKNIYIKFPFRFYGLRPESWMEMFYFLPIVSIYFLVWLLLNWTGKLLKSTKYLLLLTLQSNPFLTICWILVWIILYSISLLKPIKLHTGSSTQLRTKKRTSKKSLTFLSLLPGRLTFLQSDLLLNLGLLVEFIEVVDDDGDG